MTLCRWARPVELKKGLGRIVATPVCPGTGFSAPWNTVARQIRLWLEESKGDRHYLLNNMQMIKAKNVAPSIRAAEINIAVWMFPATSG
jgi:hypothetical protein